ncbi:MAG: FAD-dependent oxidoreductase [Armatimonadetes bacterium]|nr:FAD-dependent oxidoreductase [Armatimonadota bacterium]
MSSEQRYAVVVVGGGSGGIGAALAAARLGCRVLLVEQAETLGGTAVRAGVHTWEPGVGGTGLPFEIYRRLKAIPGAVGIYTYGRHVCWGDRYPGGEQLIDPSRVYLDTLQRHATGGIANEEVYRRQLHGVTFEPAAYLRVVGELLSEAGCEVRTKTTFTGVDAAAGRVERLRLDDGSAVTAGTVIDSTAEVALCRACGCRTMLGDEPRSRFGEPSAPDGPRLRVNGVTLVYRVTPSDRPGVEPLPGVIPAECWWSPEFPVASVSQYPCGDLNVNALPTMEGAEFLALGYEAAYHECRRRSLAHWHHLQREYAELQQFRLAWLAPALGVRSGHRVVAEYVLREQDLRAGLAGQGHPDVTALADHSLDTHGADAVSGELAGPYGVPFRSLVPVGWRNLLAACRGAGFTALAASSCRLSRTMMQLGQAVGTAAALAHEAGCDVVEVPPGALRLALRAQHVQLDWPLAAELRAYLEDDGATGSGV